MIGSVEIFLFQKLEVASGNVELAHGWRRVIMRTGRHIIMSRNEVARMRWVFGKKSLNLRAKVSKIFPS